MYNQTSHRDKKYICCYCLQSFSAVQVLEKHVNDCFKINSRKTFKITKKVKLLNSKTIQG